MFRGDHVVHLGGLAELAGQRALGGLLPQPGQRGSRSSNSRNQPVLPALFAVETDAAYRASSNVL